MLNGRFAKPRRAVAAKRRVAVIIATAACGFGAVGVATASADTFVTPYWGMTCTTSESQSSGSATCTGLGKWRVAVSCAWGFTYTSVWYINNPDQTQTATAGDCWWGVDSVSVEEART